MTHQHEYIFKTIITGDSGTGKSSLLLRLTDDRFIDTHDATIGVEFGVRTLVVDGVCIKLQIWDTAGQENFRSITRSYYRNAACALLVYDIGKMETFQSIESVWCQELEKHSSSSAFVLLIGNKSDTQRMVPRSMAESFAERFGFSFIETSAKTGDNVSAAFEEVATGVLRKINMREVDLSNSACGVKQTRPPLDERISPCIETSATENSVLQCCSI